MKKVTGGGEGPVRALPITSGDRSKRWRERFGRPSKRRGSRPRPGSAEGQRDRGAGLLASQSGETTEKSRPRSETQPPGDDGSNVDIYV